MIKPMDATTPWQTFAYKLFKTEDADPGYIAIARSGLPEDQIKRLIVAWLTFYDLGFAAWVSEFKGRSFWEVLFNAYPTAKRNSERRHFRGAAGLSALAHWQTNFREPEMMMDRLLKCDPNYMSIRKSMRPIPQMGDYFIWKLCDLYDVLTKKDVTVVGQEHHAPKVPQEGAQLIAEQDRMDTDFVTKLSSVRSSRPCADILLHRTTTGRSGYAKPRPSAASTTSSTPASTSSACVPLRPGVG